MPLQHELPTLISRLRQATERLDWNALALTHLQVVRLLLKTNHVLANDRPDFQRLRDAHAHACQLSQKAERCLQDEVQTLRDILADGRSHESP